MERIKTTLSGELSTLHQILGWLMGVIADLNYSDLIRTLAPVATALIALSALRNWQRQDKAKREAEFLDSLIDAVHTYVADMVKPNTLLQLMKIGVESHAQDWEEGDLGEIAINGAIAYIQRAGLRDATRLSESLDATRPAVAKLKFLTAKGQIYNFPRYGECRHASQMLTWQFDRIEAFAAVASQTTLNWEHPQVRAQLKKVMIDLSSDEVGRHLQVENIAVLEFVSDTYKAIYGRSHWRKPPKPGQPS